MLEYELVRCRYCDRVVFWVDTVKGKRMPLEPKPNPWERPHDVEANIVIENRQARALSRYERWKPEPAGQVRYVCHWALSPYCRKVAVDFRHRRRQRDGRVAQADALRGPDPQYSRGRR